MRHLASFVCFVVNIVLLLVYSFPEHVLFRVVKVWMTFCGRQNTRQLIGRFHQFMYRKTLGVQTVYMLWV